MGWQDAALATAITLTPGSTYVVSVCAATDFHFVDDVGFLDSAIVDGPVTYPGSATAKNGVIALSANTFPSVTGSGDFYFVDLDFIAQ